MHTLFQYDAEAWWVQSCKQKYSWRLDSRAFLNKRKATSNSQFLNYKFHNIKYQDYVRPQGSSTDFQGNKAIIFIVQEKKKAVIL